VSEDDLSDTESDDDVDLEITRALTRPKSTGDKKLWWFLEFDLSYYF